MPQTLKVRSKANIVVAELTEEELILTPTIVYGFNLADKVWRKCLNDASSFF